MKRVSMILIVSVVLLSSTVSLAVDDGLVGWWKMDNIQDGKVVDSSGKGNDGEIVGICEQTEGFVGNGGLKITNGGMQIPNSPLLDARQFTIAMWVNWADGQGALARLLQMGNDNKESIAILGGGGATNGGASANVFYFSIFTTTIDEEGDASMSTVKSPGVFEGGTWRHLAAIYDGSDLLVYVDGKVVGNKTIGDVKLFTDPNSSSLVLGCRPPNMDRTFNGVVDDVRMYNKALSAQDVSKLYVFKGGSASKAAMPNPADKSGNILPTSKLKWMKGANADSSAVYFGTDEAAVEGAKAGDAQYKGSTSKESFDPGRLEFDTTYFWRVDSVAKDAVKAKPAATDGLVGWWKCDDATGEIVKDSSGKGHDGKVFGVTKWEKGCVGNGALKITNFQEGENITNGGVVIADSPELRPSRFTVAMWVKWSADFRQKAWCRILQKGNDNKETFVIIGGGGADDRGNADNGLSFAIAQETRGDVYSVTVKGETFEGGKWYHVAVSYDGADMSLYVNGKVAVKKTIGDVELIGIEGEPLVIGSRPPNMDRGFYGAVDDVRMYNKALSAADIRKLSTSKGGGASKGDVWSFSTLAGKAENPTPDPLLKNIATNIKLTWDASSLAKSHDVYFGDDRDAVANATKGSKLHKGTFGIGKEELDPGKLEEGKFYYWRVDENCGAGIAKGNVWEFRTEGGGLVIQVDLAIKTCDNSELYPGLAKPGWTIWASNAWSDMYMHDYRIFPLKEDGSGLDEAGIDGTGVTLWFTTGNEGQLGIGAKGICRDNLGGGGCPSGTAQGDPIANSWAYGVDWVGPYAGDLLLLIQNLPAGTYQVNSYHNFWEPCTQSTRNCLNCDCGMPPMPAITARSLPEQLVSLDANGVRTEGGWTWKANLPVGDGKGVEPILNAYNVAPQHVLKDSELVPSVIKFKTDGSDVLVIYEADRSEPLYPDCARKGREGARGILNAFEIIAIEK